MSVHRRERLLIIALAATVCVIILQWLHWV